MIAVRIVSNLKRSLKSRGIHYEDVAKVLGISVSSFKRILATGKLSLQRLEFLCHHYKIENYEIFPPIKDNRWEGGLSPEVEDQLVAHPFALGMLAYFHRGIELSELRKICSLSSKKMNELLVFLQQLKLIQWDQVSDEVKVWKKGKIFYRHAVHNLIDFETNKNFLNYSYQRLPFGYEYKFQGDMALTQSEAQQLLSKFDLLAKEIITMSGDLKARVTESMHEERRSLGLLLMIRPWQPVLEELLPLKKSQGSDDV